MSIPLIKFQDLVDILDRLNTEGEFVASVLTDIDGIPLVSAVTGERDLTEPLAAVVPLVRQSVQRSNEQVGLAEANEVVVNNSDGARLVSRFFAVERRLFILVCVVPVKRPYRKVMNKAIQGLNRLWQQPAATGQDMHASPALHVVAVSDPQLVYQNSEG
jgi:predicted regulator of Ras-like GTPase activity (Roadblock/LC7/MglB family)